MIKTPLKIAALVFVPCTIYVPSAVAAIPTAKPAAKGVLKAPAPGVEGVKMALSLPLENRLQTLRKKGTGVLAPLEAVAFSASETLETRWRAVTSAGRLFPKKAEPMLERALKSDDWYMRNAAMVVVPYGERDWAVKWSKIMMHDQALVVRTAAVESIRKLHAVEAEDLLWEKLYSSENYSRGKSLWIRKHIAEALTSFAHPGQEAGFSKMLKDEDVALHAPAAKGLNKLSKRDLSRDEWLRTVQ